MNSNSNDFIDLVVPMAVVLAALVMDSAKGNYLLSSIAILFEVTSNKWIYSHWGTIFLENK